MRSVEFNWLTIVNDVEYDKQNNIVKFTISNSESYVDAFVTPTRYSDVDLIDGSIENAVNGKIAQLSNEDVCIVADYDQVNAINGMPFGLTAYQFNDLNSFLYDHILETNKWAI